MARHVRKNDVVMVTAGNDRGVTGKVLRVLPKDDRVVVEGVNVRTKHLRRSQKHPQGGVIELEMPIHISNVSPLADGKPTRVRFETRKDGSKACIAARTGKELHALRGAKEKSGK